jgi:hypothetical protein
MYVKYIKIFTTNCQIILYLLFLDGTKFEDKNLSEKFSAEMKLRKIDPWASLLWLWCGMTDLGLGNLPHVSAPGAEG